MVMTWPVELAVFGSMAVLIALSYLQWTGQWRSWYRPRDPALRVLFATLGPSPLLVPTLLGGVLVMIGLILVSSVVHVHLLVDIGIAFGIGGLAIGGWIGFAQ